jgi:hypothetical protein
MCNRFEAGHRINSQQIRAAAALRAWDLASECHRKSHRVCVVRRVSFCRLPDLLALGRFFGLGFLFLGRFLSFGEFLDCAKTMELALPRCEITILSDFYIFEKNVIIGKALGFVLFAA